MNNPPKMVHRSTDIAHGLGRIKSITFKAIPNVISKGRVIDYQPNWKNRGYDTVVIAAPINVKSVKDGTLTEYIMAVVVEREVGKNEQRFYVHEALAIKKDELLFKTGAASNSSGVPGSNSSAIYSLLQKVINNNSRQEKNATSTYSISEDSQTIDKKYQKAVDSGNMQLAQKLVEKRAKQNGYELFGYVE